MNKMTVDGGMLDAVVEELSQSNMFAGLSKEDLQEVAKKAAMTQYDSGEVIMKQGAPSDFLSVIVSGEAIVQAMHETRKEMTEVARIKPFNTIGELGLLLGQSRSATVVAGPDLILLTFDQGSFTDMFKRMPQFGLVICRSLAKRLQAGRSVPIPPASEKANHAVQVDPAAMNLLSVDFIQRHRVLPLKVEGHLLHLGFVDDPTPQVIAMAREQLPGMELRPVAIDVATFSNALRSAAGRKEEPKPAAIALEKKKATVSMETAKAGQPMQLDQILKRMVAEGASDVHLSAGHKPRWRIDGEMYEMSDTSVLGPATVLEMTTPIMPERNRAQFKSDNDTDFAYAIPGVARYRVNVFADNHGVGAVFRQIPDKILSIAQLGLPPIISELCDYPKGLVLVTGPTGSGKSTTLAAMLDYINDRRQSHVITLEDPIEFVHVSKKCLVNQREIGPHSTSFARALRAVLREDPDIVLVGEMRDLETVALALETANTGHLVFATLHTNTAVSTIARVIDMFQAEQQNQVRAVLADNLRGVVAQTLCRRIGGGRVAALEIMVSDIGVANLIREGKTHQIMSAMQTGKARGNRILNEELVRLVAEKSIDETEAISKAVDKVDLTQKLTFLKQEQAGGQQKAGKK
jgi:twitching motility protein PilT